MPTPHELHQNLNCKSFVKTTYCKHGVVVICQSDTRTQSPGSTAAFFFITAACLGLGNFFTRKAGQLDPQTLVGSLGARHGTSRSKSVAITMRSRDIELQNTKELRATAPDIAAPKPEATLTQPLHSVLQHHVANPHVSTHLATEHDNNHAAITLRSATKDSTSE